MNILYWISWLASKFVFSIVFHGKIIGKENIPKTGGFIFASNHISYYDPPFLGSCVNREMNYMAKDTLFKNKLVAWIISHVNARPVKRGGFDRKAMETSIELVKSGKGILIFPEGTRSKTDNLLPPRPGIGKIAVEAQCVIVPAYIHASNYLWHSFIGKKRLFVACGVPLSVDWLKQFSADKESYLKISQKIMDEIAKLKSDNLKN